MAENKIYPFATASDANTLTDEEYQTLLGSELRRGMEKGIARSIQANKVWRQSSVMASGLAQFLTNSGFDTNDALTPDALATNIRTAINQGTLIAPFSPDVAGAIGGYPRYAVVADDTVPGLLYSSNVPNNKEPPKPGSDKWTALPPSPEMPVTAFGVIDDPTGGKAEANTAAYLQALNIGAGRYRLVHARELTVFLNPLTVAVSNLDLRIDGVIKAAAGVTGTLISIGSGATALENLHIHGTGTLDGNKASQTGALQGLGFNSAEVSNAQTISRVIVQDLTFQSFPNAPIYMANVKDAELTKLIVSGTGSLTISGCSQVWINNSRFTSITSDSANVSSAEGAAALFTGPNQYCGAKECDLTNGSLGFAVMSQSSDLNGSEGLILTRNHVKGMAGRAIFVSGGSNAYHKDITITENIFEENSASGEAGGGAVLVSNIRGGVIESNIFLRDGSTAETGILTQSLQGVAASFDNSQPWLSANRNQFIECGKGFGNAISILADGIQRLEGNTALNSKGDTQKCLITWTSTPPISFSENTVQCTTANRPVFDPALNFDPLTADIIKGQSVRTETSTGRIIDTVFDTGLLAFGGSVRAPIGYFAGGIHITGGPGDNQWIPLNAATCMITDPGSTRTPSTTKGFTLPVAAPVGSWVSVTYAYTDLETGPPPGNASTQWFTHLIRAPNRGTIMCIPINTEDPYGVFRLHNYETVTFFRISESQWGVSGNNAWAIRGQQQGIAMRYGIARNVGPNADTDVMYSVSWYKTLAVVTTEVRNDNSSTGVPVVTKAWRADGFTMRSNNQFTRDISWVAFGIDVL